MVQSEILNRVFRLVYGDPDKKKFSSGSAFTMECNHSQFLVTARHIFKTGEGPLPEHGVIWLLEGRRSYIPYIVDIKYPADPIVDIAVLKCEDHSQFSQVNSNLNESNEKYEELKFGQDVFFLGFPHNYDELLLSFPNEDRPMPLIKKAFFSGRFEDKNACMLFDGYNNEGFSGGPVCYRPADAPDGEMSIAAVIAGYRIEEQRVYDENNQPTGSYVQSNSGILEAYDIKEAIKVAEHWDDKTW